MKTTMRGLLVTALFVVGGMVMSAGNAQCADEPLPPEVKKLIGMKIPPVRVEGKDIKRAPWAKPLPSNYVQLNPASVPDFISHGGINLRMEMVGESLLVDEGMYKKRWPVFLVIRITENREKEILDVKLLPVNLINWRFNADKHSIGREYFKRINGRFGFASCESNSEGDQFIFGLVKPEYDQAAGCVHAHTERVAKAWQVDKLTGLTTPITTQGLRCDYVEQLEIQCE